MLDLEETKQEILAKIQEIEEMQAQVTKFAYFASM